MHNSNINSSINSKSMQKEKVLYPQKGMMIEWRWLHHLRETYSWTVDAKGDRNDKPHFFRSGSSRSGLLCKEGWAEIGSRYRTVTSVTGAAVTPTADPKQQSRSGDVIQSLSTVEWQISLWWRGFNVKPKIKVFHVQAYCNVVLQNPSGKSSLKCSS